MFIFLPNVLKDIPGGGFILTVFFLAVVFAALTSLINLYEAPTATLQELFHLKRPVAAAIIGVIGIVVGLIIAPIVSQWMDVLSIYICPLGAGLAGVMFFWICGKKYVQSQVDKGRSSKFTDLYYPICKYIYVPICVLVLILGIVLGGIG